MRESVPCFSDESIKDKGAAFERNLVLFVVLELLIPLLPSFTAAMLLLESSPEIITNFYYTFGRSWNLLIYLAFFMFILIRNGTFHIICRMNEKVIFC